MKKIIFYQLKSMQEYCLLFPPVITQVFRVFLVQINFQNALFLWHTTTFNF